MSKIDRRAFLSRSASVTLGATFASVPGLMLGDRTFSHAQFLPIPNLMDNNLMDTDTRALRSLAQTCAQVEQDVPFELPLHLTRPLIRDTLAHVSAA